MSRSENARKPRGCKAVSECRAPVSRAFDDAAAPRDSAGNSLAVDQIAQKMADRPR